MTSKGSLLFFCAVFLAFAENCSGQRAWNWRVYSVADGLPEAACVSVVATPQGKVLVRQLSQTTLSELDGYGATVLPAPAAGTGRVFESPGGQLWTATPEGLQEFKEGHWVLHAVPEIIAEFRASSRVFDPIPLCPVRQGHVIYLLSERLVEFNSEDPDSPRSVVLLNASRTGLQKFTGMTLARDGSLWISGKRGVLKVPAPIRSLKPECDFLEYPPPAELQLNNFRDPHTDGADGLSVIGESVTNQVKWLAQFDGTQWRLRTDLPQRTHHAWCNGAKSCWAMTPDSLFQWDTTRRELVENEEVGARQYFDVAVEPGGSFCIASSDGMMRYSPLLWQTPSATPGANSPVLCIAGDQERLWYIAGNVLYGLPLDNLSGASPSSYPLNGDQSPRALYPLKNGMLLLEVGEELLKLEPGDHQLVSQPFTNGAGRLKPLGLLSDGALCVQVFDSTSPDRSHHLESFDGIVFKPVLDGLAGSGLNANLLCAFVAQNGDVWLGAENGTAVYHDKKWRTFNVSDGSVPQGAITFVELADGKIWCATQEKVWEFDGRIWSRVRTGFDRINAMLRSRDGSIWVGSNGGLQRFLRGSWVENGLEEGLPGTVIRQLYEDARGRLWTGTTHGLSLYHPDADVDPPQTSIQELSDKESRIPEGRTVSIVFNGVDKWKQTTRLRLLYSYRLDERDWSSFQTENSISLADLPAGKHYFQARAMDRNCNLETKPARIEFAITLPWYKESRLVMISMAGAVAVLFFAGVAFNRHRRLVRSYAEVERKVEDRTRELELANRALVHSQKMNALGTLAAGIAHDFNNILSIIKGSAQIIGDNLTDRQKVTTRVDRINTAVEQGTGIVRAMLGFSRDSDQQATLADVNAIVEETLKLLGDRFLREVQASFDRSPELPPVSCAPDFVQQILLNLIFNAAESMEKPKRIILTTQPGQTPPPHAVLAPGTAGRYVAISVRDFGCGIPPENLPRIFEPFFTTKAFSARRGTGLGLSMVYELAKKMGAGLMVESVVDQGSIFTLLLPVKDSPGVPTIKGES